MKTKKWLAILLEAVMVLTMLPCMAFAADLPNGPVENGNIWTVNPENAQYTLDGAYGSINGKTIHFSKGTYNEVLVLTRPTKYKGSNTRYYNMSWTQENGWVKADEPLSYDRFMQSPSNIVTYERAVHDVTFTAEEGVVLPGFESSSGHVYSEAYDYVQDRSVTSANNSYYGVCSLQNITFSGLTIEDGIYIANYVQNGDAVNTGIRVLNCVFEGNATEMVANGYVAIKLKADSRVFEDIEVSGCRFTNYFQGIYTQGTDGLQVKNNVFNGTTHNAIAVQTGASNEVRGEVVIEENIIKNANDRAIRLGNAAAAEKITIQNNVMVNSGDADGELIKGNFPSSSVVSLEHNYWAGKDVSTAVANEEVRPQTTGIAGGTFNEPVIEYVAQGSTAISYAVTEGEAPTTFYAVGNDAETAANNAIAGATITVLKGDSITVPDQVNVINQTGGDITVNGATVANNQQVEAHSISTDWTYNNAAHWHECSVCHQKKTGEAPHTLEWKVDKEPTETENGSKHEECTVCGYMGATGEIPATGETPPAYQIIEGANGSWTQNTDGTLAFRANGPFDKFTGVKVDGRLLNAGSYTAKSDSTVITLKAGYLKTLSNGAHTLTVVYTDGECSTGFTVKAAAALPKTGDAGQPALWLALLALAAAGLSAALYGKKSCGGKA